MGCGASATASAVCLNKAPRVLERKQLDILLAERMAFKSGGPFTVTAMYAVARLKLLRRSASGMVREMPAVEAADKSSKETASREVLIEAGKKRLNERLTFMGLRAVDVANDGNCLFRAISQELYFTQEHHGEVRKAAVEYMTANSAEYSAFSGDKAEWLAYSTSMAKLRTWGDELGLRAVCDSFGVVVHLVTSDATNWHLIYQPKTPYAPYRHIFLAYISPIHYNSVELFPVGII